MRDGARDGCHTTDAARRGGRLVTSACPVATKATPMADILIFHHALGLTPGVQAFADTLRQAGHTVHAPDLYEGRRFDTLDAGVAHAKRSASTPWSNAACALPTGCRRACSSVGFSLGVLPAQKLAQTRPGARGALAAVRLRAGDELSRPPGRQPCRCRCTRPRPTRISWATATSTPRAPCWPRRRAPNCSCTLARSTCLPRSARPGPRSGVAALLMQRVLAFLAAG
jgi:hypothetical protein